MLAQCWTPHGQKHTLSFKIFICKPLLAWKAYFLNYSLTISTYINMISFKWLIKNFDSALYTTAQLNFSNLNPNIYAKTKL